MKVLNTLKKRGATILAEVVGYGSNCDAYHQTTPTPDGSGAAKAIELAIKEAGISPEDVDYVNAHGTSTQANEKGESKAIVTVLVKMFQYLQQNHSLDTFLVLLVLLKLSQLSKQFATTTFQ